MRSTLNKILEYSIIKYEHNVVQQISRTFSSFLTETLPVEQLPISPTPSNQHSTFLFYDFDYISYLIQMESFSVCLFVIGLFDLALYLQGSSPL